jgi:hypothetical protein
VLTGFNDPLGECIDKAGDVWIVNALAGQILEYAHGGTSPIATLSDSLYMAGFCSVSARTGDLAVASAGISGSGGVST